MDKQPTVPHALLVIFAGITAALHVGKLAPAIPVLQQAMDVSMVQAGFLLSLVQMAGMLLGLAVGVTVVTVGLRRCLLAGLALLSVASVAGAFAQSVAGLLFFRALEGAGFLLVATPAPSLIRRFVPPQQLSGLLGLWGTYMPLGTALVMFFAPVLMALTSWQTLWHSLALLSMAMFVVIVYALPSDKTWHQQHPPRQALNWRLALRLTLTARGPWLVALCFCVYSGQWLAVMGFLPSIYTQAGMPSATAGLLTALVAGANLIGNAASGWLLQRGQPPVRLLLIGYVTMALGAGIAFGDWRWDADTGTAAAVSATTIITKYLSVCLFSAVGGLIPGTLFSLAVKISANEDTVSTTVGWMQQLSATGQFMGPPLVAMAASHYGGWGATAWVSAVCSILGVVLALELQGLLRKREGVKR